MEAILKSTACRKAREGLADCGGHDEAAQWTEKVNSGKHL